jgi:hypothetical protein
MATEYGVESLEILISESGDTQKQRVLVFTLGKMEIDTKENGGSV